MHCAIKGTPIWTVRRRRRRQCSRGQSYTSLNAASCCTSIVRRGRSAFSISERTIFALPPLPSYVERASKRVLPSRRVEAARARTYARTRSGFIHKVTRFARKRLRARVNDRNRRLRPFLLAYLLRTYSREKTLIRAPERMLADDFRSIRMRNVGGCTAGNKNVAVNVLAEITLFLFFALCKLWNDARNSIVFPCRIINFQFVIVLFFHN